MHWELVLAWSTAALCSLLALRLRRGLRRWNAPPWSALLSELLAEVGADSVDSEWARRAAIAELNRRLSDVSFALASLPARFTALTRIALASGTALALIGYIGANGNPSTESGSAPTPLERVVQLVACALSGLVGAACVGMLGRVAKRRSAEIRNEWDRTSREIAKSLGTSLAAPLRKGAGNRDDRGNADEPDEGSTRPGGHESRREQESRRVRSRSN